MPDGALEVFGRAEVELILHAGDLSTLAAIQQLEAYAPVVAVQGNVETPETVAALPIKREIVVGGCEIGLVHILGSRADYAHNARREFPTARVVIFGHSHQPYLRNEDGLMLLNPGSATDRSREPRCTVALLTIEDGQPRAEIIPLATCR